MTKINYHKVNKFNTIPMKSPAGFCGKSQTTWFQNLVSKIQRAYERQNIFEKKKKKEDSDYLFSRDLK